MPPKRQNPARRITSTRRRTLPARPAPRPKLTREEREDLTAALKDMLKGNSPHDIQIELTCAQEEGRDGLGQAPTGHGKTAIAAGPYALEKNRVDKRVTLMVSPLIGLQDEMVRHYSELIPWGLILNSAYYRLKPFAMSIHYPRPR